MPRTLDVRDLLEAERMALAVRHLRGPPLTYPGTTGVDAPCPGGRLVEASGRRPRRA